MYSRNKGNCSVLQSLSPYMICNSDWNLCTGLCLTVLHSNETKEFKLLMSSSKFIYFSVFRKWKIKKLFFMLYFSFIPKWKFQESFPDHLFSVCPSVTFYLSCSPKLGAISMKFVKRYFRLRSFQFYASEGPFKWR